MGRAKAGERHNPERGNDEDLFTGNALARVQYRGCPVSVTRNTRHAKYPRRLRFFERVGEWAHSTAQIQVEPHDFWVGMFWRFERWHDCTGSDRRGDYRNPWTLHLYICLLPLLPIHVYVHRTVR